RPHARRARRGADADGGLRRRSGCGRSAARRRRRVGNRLMALKDHVVADSDLHVMEPPDLWQRYIDPTYAHAAPIGLSELQRDMRVRVKNHSMLRLGRVRPLRVEGRKTGWREEHDNVYAGSEARGWDAASQVDAMD